MALLIYDERMLEHRPPGWDPDDPGPLSEAILALLRATGNPASRWVHPERPERLSAVWSHLTANPVPGVRHCTAEPADWNALARVHDAPHLEIMRALQGRTALLDPDTTAVSPNSVEAARVAAGATMAAVDAVAGEDAESAFALVRPPGHHAERARARGFCLFNNVAVAAAHARATHGYRRILIVDWDAHHGNGTQQIFLDDPETMFFDTHRAAPFFPGTGALEEIGNGAARGTNLNVPLPDAAGDSTLLRAFREILAPAAARFRPELVLVSAGFDSHREDLAMQVTESGFAALTDIVREIARQHAGGRLALVLEGGYHTEPLARSVRAVLEVLAGGPAPEIEMRREAAWEALDAAVDFHSGVR